MPRNSKRKLSKAVRKAIIGHTHEIPKSVREKWEKLGKLQKAKKY